MAKEPNAEIMMPQGTKPETAEMLAFLGTLNQDESKEMLAFFQGVKFGRRLAVATDRPNHMGITRASAT